MSLHIRTPLIHSRYYSNRIGKPVYLKLDSLQPTGSFKIRGIGHYCESEVSRGVRRFVSSSGGNAGIAAAYSVRVLGGQITVVVPEPTKPAVIARLKSENAEVIVHGKVWDEAHERALQIAEKTGAAYIHPFDHPKVWQGNSSLIDEIADELPNFDAIVVAVGGGGLYCGVAEGLDRHNFSRAKIIAAETEGAASFRAALEAGAPVSLDKVETIATTLGARRVADKALEWSRIFRTFPQIVSDDEAVSACVRLADEHRILVEPGCGAALAAAEKFDASRIEGPIVIVVCGGVGISWRQLLDWKESSNKLRAIRA